MLGMRLTKILVYMQNIYGHLCDIHFEVLVCYLFRVCLICFKFSSNKQILLNSTLTAASYNNKSVNHQPIADRLSYCVCYSVKYTPICVDAWRQVNEDMFIHSKSIISASIAAHLLQVLFELALTLYMRYALKKLRCFDDRRSVVHIYSYVVYTRILEPFHQAQSEGDD